jgi:hypothetical protein
LRYTENREDAVCRVAFLNEGYYSYLGKDCEHIPRNQHTMNLEGFTLRTADSEWERVPVHEVGHFWGCPHEHQRKEIIDRLDREGVYDLFKRTQGWSKSEVDQQVLTPLEERSLMGASPADEVSIMTYAFPGTVTKNRKPILGGGKISAIDRQFFAKIYPEDGVVIPPTRDDIHIIIRADGSVEIDGVVYNKKSSVVV